MRKVSVLILLVLQSAMALGQKDVPSYGKIDKDDLTMNTCDFDPEADACVLIKTGESTFTLNGQAYIQTAYRFRIKILKDKGIDRANIKIGYYSKDRIEEIDNINGETYNLDAGGNIVKTKLEKANIYDKPINKYYSEIAFTLPDVKKGSVIEYKYLKISKRLLNIEDWYFQEKETPIRYCQFFVSIPSVLAFTYKVHNTLPINEKDESYAEAQRTFTMKNVPALRDEPYMSAPNDYLQRIEFQLSAIRIPGEAERPIRSNWTAVCQELQDDEDFGGQLHRNIPHTQELDQRLAGLKDSLSRMVAVYDYVRQHMDWNGYGNNIYSAGVRSSWDKKTGDVSDINFILVNLLRDAGLEAYPLLCSTRSHGRTNQFYPILEQFNETLAYVRIGDHSYTLDASDKYTPYWMIPLDVHYTLGLVVEKDNPSWTYLIHDQDRYKTVVIFNGDVDATGKLTGSASISSFGYSRSGRQRDLKQGMDHFKETYFTKPYTSLHVDSVSIEDADNDSLPLKQTVDFTEQLSSSGQYTFFSPNLFLGLEKNPFVAERRFTDVDFRARRSFMIVGSLSIPDGYTFETPKNIRMIMQDTSIVLERLLQADDTHINYRISLEFKRPVYFANEYDDFREFYKKLFSTLSEQVVIRKKS